MLLWLEFILRDCVGESSQDGDHIVALDRRWQALEPEGIYLALIIAQEFDAIAVNGSHGFCSD